jgi:arylsulfatase A-like enzyme
MIWRWQGRIPAVGVFTELVSSMDLAPTITALMQDSAASSPGNRPSFDGVDLLPYLQRARAGAPHDHLCWQQQL